MTQLPAERPPLTSLRRSAFPTRPTSRYCASDLKSRLCKAALIRALRGLKRGRLTVLDGPDAFGLGESQAGGLQASITVHDSAFYTQTILGGSLGAAESYLRGDWSCDDLTQLMRILAQNLDAVHQFGRGWGKPATWGARVLHKIRRNTRSGSRRNIHEHYDLGNDFFALFLDETMQYSSAIFEDHQTALKDASVAKMDRICRKLRLRPDDHLLEIGTGWGGFAQYAAINYGCRVTTTTISKAQFDYARSRIAAAGLADQVTILLEYYRDLRGSFDKIASIEMIEAVGHEHLNGFFRKCGELLRPDGAMLLQAITMPDRHYGRYLKSVDFIQRYIFPGGCLPSVTAMNQAIASQTSMRLVHLEDFAAHYAQTLRCWRDRFWNRIDDVRALGYSERFIRMWHYYLCYCEAAFCERTTGVVQMLLVQPDCRIDGFRDS